MIDNILKESKRKILDKMQELEDKYGCNIPYELKMELVPFLLHRELATYSCIQHEIIEKAGGDTKKFMEEDIYACKRVMELNKEYEKTEVEKHGKSL